jgi:hypothetical protein
MSDTFLDRFFGRGTPKLGELPVANPRLTDPVGLQLLFPENFALDAGEVTKALRDYHPDLARATAELYDVPPNPEQPAQPHVIGMFAWERHVVKMVAYYAPMPRAAVETSVLPAHIGPEYKQLAYAHKAHALLYYAGYESDPLEQYVALAACAGALAYFGAEFVLNETARTAIPAATLHPHEEDAGDMLGALRGLPLPFLYCGFVKLEVEGIEGVWMRTYGCHRFGLPDFATLAAGHEYGSETFEQFGSMLNYLRQSGKRFSVGDTMQVGDDAFLKLRAPTAEEWFLDTEGEMLVAFAIGADEANARPAPQ